ncbi:cytochrome C [Bordetella genomosp. 10]|uniref:Cytochrome C n=1 Tax=Bordetella genomosp. 10 TaxID=1416804 RepID=A0A261S2I0_9BORD|nr:c-type cytochrome [Bordetella genomosp. 10]OZI31000.1 cytochrome C [Bordetella genomosp. 10]
MKKTAIAIGLVFILGCAGFWILTAPWAWTLVHRPSRDIPDEGPANLANGHLLFTAAACAICHATPNQPNENLLGGGKTLTSDFGAFHMPNISPDVADGIGSWSTAQFIRAMREGITPHGENEYPAFPYPSYQRMTANDLRDILAYIKTLPPVHGKAPAHDLKFPFTIRRAVGAWRMLFLDGKALAPGTQHDERWLRGRYLVEAVAHCAECHSPRNALGAIPADRRYAGGPSPDGSAYVPNISPDETGIGYWSVNEIARYLKEGLTPLNIPAGGDMREIVHATAKLSADDRLAMAAYLKTLAPIDAPNAGVPEPNRTAEVKVLPARANAGASQLATLAASSQALERADTAYVVVTQPFYLSAEDAASGAKAPDGKFLAASPLKIVSRRNGLLQVRLDGWRQQGSDNAMYALPGQRILQSVLAPSAIPMVRTGENHSDVAGQTWRDASLTAWIKPAGLATDMNVLWQYNSKVFNATCSACHAVPETQGFLANQWIGTLKSMKLYTSLSDDEYRQLLVYLQFHAKDTLAATQRSARQ